MNWSLEKINPTVHTKMSMSRLFKAIKAYHCRKLKEKFRRHYKPWRTGNWTSRVSKKTLNDLRLHLSWELGMNTFHWDKYKIGNEIIRRFEELGILSFLKKIIEIDRKK